MSASTNTLRIRLFAYLLGAICHLTFIFAVTAMAYSIFYGLGVGFGNFSAPWNYAVNLLLILQFPLLHSVLLSRAGRKFLAELFPPDIGNTIVTTTYATIASAQLLVLFVCWTPSNILIWLPTGVVYNILAVFYVGAWILLAKSMFDAGLGTQLGFVGWRALAKNAQPKYRPFPTSGLFRYTRQPIYLSFVLVLLTAPHWTFDRLMLTLIWSAYLYFAPRLKERRYIRHYGNDFKEYQQAVPYWIPIRFSRFSLLLVVAALLVTPQSRAQDRRWPFPERLNDSNTTITFNVDSTWHTVEGKTSGIGGTIIQKDIRDFNSIHAEVKIPVARFNTERESRDERLREVMAAEQFPFVEINIFNIAPGCLPERITDSSPCSTHAPATLLIRGVSKAVELPLHISRNQDSSLQASGSLTLSWQDFGIEDPSILVAKLAKDVTVQYTVQLGR